MKKTYQQKKEKRNEDQCRNANNQSEVMTLAWSVVQNLLVVAIRRGWLNSSAPSTSCKSWKQSWRAWGCGWGCGGGCCWSRDLIRRGSCFGWSSTWTSNLKNECPRESRINVHSRSTLPSKTRNARFGWNDFAGCRIRRIRAVWQIKNWTVRFGSKIHLLLTSNLK